MDLPFSFLPSSYWGTRLPDDAELRRQMPLQSLFQLAPWPVGIGGSLPAPVVRMEGSLGHHLSLFVGM